MTMKNLTLLLVAFFCLHLSANAQSESKQTPKLIQEIKKDLQNRNVLLRQSESLMLKISSEKEKLEGLLPDLTSVATVEALMATINNKEESLDVRQLAVKVLYGENARISNYIKATKTTK